MSEAAAPPPAGHSREVIGPGHTFASVTDKISSIVLTRKTPLFWGVGFFIGFLLTLMLLFAVGVLFLRGIGIWGVNIPVGWGFAIVNFVWWIGIGHAGTLISAILLLLRQEWRTSINRFAEAMTLFAVAQAGLFPLLHLGRPWLAYWLLPYPNTMALWPQWRSPLVWDVFAVSTYATVSLLFWYVGLIPDLATLRDRAKNASRSDRSTGCSPWAGAARPRTGTATRRPTCCSPASRRRSSSPCTPSSPSTSRSASSPAGTRRSSRPTSSPERSTAGFAMVLTIAIPLRAVYGLEDFITLRHLQNMAKIMLATGLIVGYGYMIEGFMGWYSGNPFEKYMMWNRLTGPYWPAFWSADALQHRHAAVPVVQAVRSTPLVLWAIAIIVNVGMWLERFVIVVTSLHRDFLPSSWGMYYPTKSDWATFIGTLGFFVALFFLFIRFLPMISIFEMRTLVPEAEAVKETEAVRTAPRRAPRTSTA